MRGFAARTISRLVIGASTLAMAAVSGAAVAQDTKQGPPTSSTLGNPGPSQTDNKPAQQPAVSPTQTTNDPVTDTGQSGDVVVTGIRRSLQESVNIKRDSQGIVDAISAEDIGKFPDTNLAESLQRITGVSIDRTNGEGSTVTVRGFGPEFNLVTLNGRQIPTATLGDAASPPSSRAFDFANLASEGIAAVEVYKSGRASVESGGIGATINIRTPRPLDKLGLRGSFAVKGVADTSRNDGVPITPEVSGIISDTFADGKIGILLNGIYQKREASVNTASVGYRDGYLGSENNWGSLAQAGDPRYANITNRPGPNSVYMVPQNASYEFQDINRERINGQAVLQIRPIESLTATVDYTYARNTVEVRGNSVGIWFNHNNTSSDWTDGPVAGPIFYSEHFNQNEGKDLAYSGDLSANRTETKLLGGNLSWKAPGGVTVVLDAHHSTAEAKPTSPFGSNNSLGNAVFGISDQSINFDNYMPVQSYQFYPGIDPLNAANVVPTGNSFRNAYFKDRINQVQLSAHYDHEGGFLDSLDFGTSYVDNAVRSAYGYYQNDTWGGALGGGTPAQIAANQVLAANSIPDNVFQLDTVRDKFAGLGGVNAANIIQQYYKFNFETEANLLKSLYNVCGPGGANASCLSPYTVDRRINERTIAPFVQVNTKFDLFGKTTHLIGGLRYEVTNINSTALVPIPVGTRWVSANEFDVIFGPNSGFTTFKGSYDNWLPSVDFDIQPLNGVKLRASYSHTIARADYASLQGGQTIDQLFRIGNGTGSLGNPGLLPYKSKNVDLSAEFYYNRDSYVSVGYFHKDVSNFIGSARVNTTAFGLTNPATGPRYNAAIAVLGANASTTDIRNYIITNFPATVNGSDILGQPNDNPLIFQITTPVNSSQTATIDGWEFAIQHSFWNTGFGTILNYTKVDGSATYDNSQPASVTQFALTGLSDSANAVAFYDKNGLQARVAYNWRGEFLTTTGPNPFYVEAYGQVDANASYEFKKGFSLFFEVINANSASRRGHTRSTRNVTFAVPQSPRYYLGARFAF